MNKEQIITASFLNEIEKTAGLGDKLKEKFRDWVNRQADRLKKKLNPNKDVPLPLPKPGEKTAQVDTSNAHILTTNEYPQ